jgi:hypothetical protein
MLDKSKGLVLGPELVTNGDFSGGTTGWSAQAGWTIGSGVASVNSSVAGGTYLRTSGFAAVTGAYYRVTFTVTSFTSGSIAAAAGTGVSTSIATAIGTYSFLVQAAGAGGVGVFAAGTTTIATIDNISVKELPGNHAVQATTANRPIYGIHPFGGRRNLLLRTEEFDNASWPLDNSGATNPIVTANAAVAPDGTTTADRIQLNKTGGTFSRVQQTANLTSLPSAIYTFSVWMRKNGSGTANVGIRINDVGLNCVVTDTWQRFSVSLDTARTNAASQILLFDSIIGNDETADIFAWGAQTETGSTATAYQRVTDQYNVTEAGVPSVSYLFFDGVNDSLATPSIDFTSTDKMTVFAGMRKLSNTTTGIPFELGNTNNGAVLLFAPFGADNNYSFRSRGTDAAAALASGYTPPITNVMAGISDIAGDNVILRLDGTQAAQTTTDQGTGTYGNYPFYIGARAGTSFFFSGHLYSLIVRGAQSNTGQISSTETWVASRTGITI